MNSKRHLFDRVRKEREKGFSLGELSKKYSLSKSTVSLWCNDMKLSQSAKKLINKRWLVNTSKGREKGKNTNKLRRQQRIEKEYKEALKIVGKLSQRDVMVLCIGLYWAEGSKKESGGGFSFINSDADMIKIIYNFLINTMNIKKDQLIIHLAVNISHKYREREILKFWSNLLDFKLEDFGNTTFIKTPHTRQYNNHTKYYGMIRLKVRSSSWLRRRILGMIKIFIQNADVAQAVRASHS